MTNKRTGNGKEERNAGVPPHGPRSGRDGTERLAGAVEAGYAVTAKVRAGFGGVDGDVVAVADGAVEDFDGEGVLDEALDGALEGAGTVGAVVAGFEDELARGGGEGEGDLAVGEHGGELGEAEVDDAGELLFAEGMEDDDIVDAVEELGAEVLAQDGEDALGGLGEAFFALGPGGGELRCAEVARS